VEFYNVPEGEFGKNGSRLALKAEVERNILGGGGGGGLKKGRDFRFPNSQLPIHSEPARSATATATPKLLGISKFFNLTN
jgi:hypothetical protein